MRINQLLKNKTIINIVFILMFSGIITTIMPSCFLDLNETNGFTLLLFIYFLYLLFFILDKEARNFEKLLMPVVFSLFTLPLILFITLEIPAKVGLYLEEKQEVSKLFHFLANVAGYSITLIIVLYSKKLYSVFFNAKK